MGIALSKRWKRKGHGVPVRRTESQLGTYYWQMKIARSRNGSSSRSLNKGIIPCVVATKDTMHTNAYDILWHSSKGVDRDDAVQPVMSIDEIYKAFKDKIGHQIPDFILSCMAHEETNKIYVDIVKGTFDEGIHFFKENTPEFLQFIKLTEQEPMAFIGDEGASYIAGSENTEVSCARWAIEAGNQLLPVTDTRIDLVELCQTKTSLEDIKKSHTGFVSTASSAGFVIDQDKRFYKLTVRHPFYGKETKEKGWEATPGDDEEDVRMLTEIRTFVHKKGCGEVVHIGDGLKSAFVPFVIEGKKKIVDLALVKVNEEVFKHPALNLTRQNGSQGDISLEIYQGYDKDLNSKEVEKTGPTTQTTAGEIIFSNQEVKINNELHGGTFIVRSTGKTEHFAQEGDSGSLVTEKIGNCTEVQALGMCFQVGSYKDPISGIIYKNVTRCVGLNHCFKFAEQKWNLQLKFCSKKDLRLLEMKKASVRTHDSGIGSIKL